MYASIRISYVFAFRMVVDGDTRVVVYVTESINMFSEPMWLSHCASLICLWVGVYI